jgi:hypothetical protein
MDLSLSRLQFQELLIWKAYTRRKDIRYRRSIISKRSREETPRPGYQAPEPGTRQIGDVGSQASLSPSERAFRQLLR